MKIAIITFHRAVNYGAVLQGWALQEKLEKLGHTVDVLNYYNDTTEQVYRAFAWNGRSGSFLSFIKECIYYPFKLERKRRFMSFIKTNLHLTRPLNASNIKKVEHEYDLFITGSDQVWNNKLTGFDKTYFLNFVTKRNKKASYAVSLGMKEIPKEYYAEYKKLIGDIEYLSMREMTGKHIIDLLTGRNSCVCLDPTLLLERNNWTKFITPLKSARKYILVYTLNPVCQMMNRVVELAEKEHIEIWYICNSLYNLKDYRNIKCLKHILTPTPGEFVSLFANATYVATNSFHGTVFSIINHKCFMTEVEYGTHRNNRIEELLRNLELDLQMLEVNGDWNKIIDWDSVDEKLKYLQHDSLAYLERIAKCD